MRDYIEYRVYIKDDKTPDVDGMGHELLMRVADELQDVLNNSIQSNCIAFAGTFVDMLEVVAQGDTTYTLHLTDEDQ
jgi:hypothetical protein